MCCFLFTKAELSRCINVALEAQLRIPPGLSIYNKATSTSEPRVISVQSASWDLASFRPWHDFEWLVLVPASCIPQKKNSQWDRNDVFVHGRKTLEHCQNRWESVHFWLDSIWLTWDGMTESAWTKSPSKCLPHGSQANNAGGPCLGSPVPRTKRKMKA